VGKGLNFRSKQKGAYKSDSALAPFEKLKVSVSQRIREKYPLIPSGFSGK
jgi:hypothetical protein